MRMLAAVLLVLSAQAATAFQIPVAVRPAVAFTHVSVIDVSNGTVHSDMTVVISGNRIAGMGRSDSIKAPKAASIVHARGKYLIPGLWDMHVHWYDKNYLSLFIANGVTGIRMMWGFPMHYAWRNDIENGTLLGPRMMIASSLVDGPNSIWPGAMVVNNAKEARDSIRMLCNTGADFVKVYGLLSREAFFALADETQKLGIAFAGHVPQSVTVIEASDAGQRSIEHLTGILEASSSAEEELRGKRQTVWNNRPQGRRIPSPELTRPLTRLMLETYIPEKVEKLSQRLKQNRTWQCPTLTVLRSTAFINDPGFRNDVRMRYLPAQFNARWDPAGIPRFKERTAKDFELARSVYKRQIEVVRLMRRAGVEFLAGTDVLNPYCFPGFSLHDELVLLVQAGLTPGEALQAATLNPARFQGREKDLGTIEQGKLADLILLNANPLEEIRNTQMIEAVVVNGEFLDRKTLDRLLAEAEALAKNR